MKNYKNLEEVIPDIFYGIEANDFVRDVLWERYSNECGNKHSGSRYSQFSWEQYSLAFAPTIGWLDGRPVSVHIVIAEINGKLIAFYDITSEVADWAMFDTWWEKNVKKPREDANMLGSIIRD